jgi:hypothetical protein
MTRDEYNHYSCIIPSTNKSVFFFFIKLVIMSDSNDAVSQPPVANRVLQELGLLSLYNSTRDIKILCVQRFIRLFAYGSSTLVLVAFLRELGVSTTRVGLFMTLTLAGDIIISFILALFADGVGRRFVLALGAVLMTASGIVFATSSNYWILLAAAILGVISPG